MKPTFLFLLTCALMTFPVPGKDDVPVPPLQIEVLLGDGGVNSLNSPNAMPIVVRVRNDAHKPVAGAKVRFQLPAAAAARGTFSGGALAFDTESDSRGEAKVITYTPRSRGAFPIEITAETQGNSAKTIIHQRNGNQGHAIAHETTVSRRKWIYVAAGAAGGVLAFSLRPKASPSATIVIGAPSVGGGR